MSAADGTSVVRITDSHGRPVRRSWRVAVQLPGPPCVLGVAILRAETATDACQLVRATYAGAVVFDVHAATSTDR